jgi:hypothetical protein
MRAGDLGAALGLKDTLTGDTLCDGQRPSNPRISVHSRASDIGSCRAENQAGHGQTVQGAAITV